jgi:hypothetical protein
MDIEGISRKRPPCAVFFFIREERDEGGKLHGIKDL